MCRHRRLQVAPGGNDHSHPRNVGDRDGRRHTVAGPANGSHQPKVLEAALAEIPALADGAQVICNRGLKLIQSLGLPLWTECREPYRELVHVLAHSPLGLRSQRHHRSVHCEHLGAALLDIDLGDLCRGSAPAAFGSWRPQWPKVRTRGTSATVSTTLHAAAKGASKTLGWALTLFSVAPATRLRLQCAPRTSCLWASSRCGL